MEKIIIELFTDVQVTTIHPPTENMTSEEKKHLGLEE